MSASKGLASPTYRGKKTARREPYWQRIREGCYLGYRKPESGEGTWIARYRKEDGGQQYKALGTFLDGKRSAFDQAAKAAAEFFDDCDAGVTPNVLTVWDACTQYVRHLRTEEGDKKATAEEARLLRLVKPERLARIELASLRPEHVRTWRQGLRSRPARVDRTKGSEPVTRPRAASTANRDMVPLRAALNFALEQGQIATDLAWREALKPVEGAGGRRTLYLTAAERRTLLDNMSEEARPFFAGLAMLPLRPGALAALNVADFDKKLATLRVGKDKAGADRVIKLPAQIAATVAAQCVRALPTAPLFRRMDGGRWNKDAWKLPIKEAATAAGLPAAVTAYTLRHSAITDLVVGGLDLMTVAQLSGTSVAMIEKHYAHLRKEHAVKALAGLAL